MTLAKAVDWISQRDKCSRREATLQIRAALADNAISMRWEDRLKYIVEDYPPVERRFWQREARIRRGRVFDPWAKQWRTLLILKHSILQHWPEPPDLASAAKGGRPSAKEKIYQALDKLSHEKGHSAVKEMPRKVLPALVAEECGKQLGNRGWSERTVQEHTQSWLEEH